MEMSSITEPISVFDFRTGSGQKAQEPVIVEMSAQAPWMDPPGRASLRNKYRDQFSFTLKEIQDFTWHYRTMKYIKTIVAYYWQ